MGFRRLIAGSKPAAPGHHARPTEAGHFSARIHQGGQSMITKNWQAILLSLLAVNLVFMGLLEMQRRVIWQNERDYFARIEQTITSTDKSTSGYDYITRQLSGITARVNNVEIAVEQLPENIKATRDIQARVNSLQTAVENLSAPKKP
jgi:hypothetical protein